MRPAYRYAVVSLGLVGLLALGGVWVLLPEPRERVPIVEAPPPEKRAEPLPLRPEGVQAVFPPVVGQPDMNTKSELLDQLEAHEAGRFGPSEAARRRRTRDTLLRGRTTPDESR